MTEAPRVPRRLAVWDPVVLRDEDARLALTALERPRPAFDAIQIRCRSGSPALLRAARCVARAAAAADIPLWINRDLMLALELGAVGVHLGPEDQQAIDAVRRNGLPYSLALHDAREAASTVARESLFVIFGHVFATPSKPGVPPRGLVALAEVVRAAAPTPVVAIGGVNARNSHEIQAAGAWGWASIRSAFTPTFDQPAA